MWEMIEVQRRVWKMIKSLDKAVDTLQRTGYGCCFFDSIT
jgi:hypothetical protein